MSDYSGRLKAEEWMICDAALDRALDLVRQFHYARGAANTATHLHGLYRRSDLQLMGIAWWIPPTKTAALAWWPEANEVLSLSRLVLSPAVPKNGATFLLAGSVKRLDPRWRCLITYADTWRNHTGHIYRACGWEYLGLTKAERTYVKDGVMIARKAGPRTRTHAEMLAIGAECIGSFARHRFRLIVRKRAPRTLQSESLCFT
jgi:hypothetical protein